MSGSLALLAMMVELGVGYPDALYRAIGHPVGWAGRLIDALDRGLNAGSDVRRRIAGILTVAVLVAASAGAGLAAELALRGWVGFCRDRRARIDPAGAAEPRPARSGRRRCPRARRARRRPGGGGAHRRARSAEPGRGGSGAGRGREPGGEFLGRGGRAGLLAVDRRVAGGRRLQGDQYRRQHDRPSLRAVSRLRVGGGAGRRPGQPAGLAADRRAPDRRRGAAAGGLGRCRLARGAAGCARASLAERGLAGGGDGGRARVRARGTAVLRRGAGRGSG